MSANQPYVGNFVPWDGGCLLIGRGGSIVPVHAHAPGAREIRSELLLVEKSVSVNTTAAGGNASLMTID